MQQISRPTSPEYCRDVEIFRKLCGDAFLSNVLLVGTKVGYTGQDKEVQSQRERMEKQRLVDLCNTVWSYLLGRGATVLELDVADRASALNILDHLPINPPPKPLQIQSEAETEKSPKEPRYILYDCCTRHKGVDLTLRRVMGPTGVGKSTVRLKPRRIRDTDHPVVYQGRFWMPGGYSRKGTRTRHNQG